MEKKRKKINFEKISSILNSPNIKNYLGVLKEYKNEQIEEDKIQILILESFEKFKLYIYKFYNEKQYIDLENTLIILDQKEKKEYYDDIEENNKNLDLTLLETININNIISISLNHKNRNIVNIKIRDKKRDNIFNKIEQSNKSGIFNIVIDFSSDKISKNFIVTFKSLISLYKTS